MVLVESANKKTYRVFICALLSLSICACQDGGPMRGFCADRPICHKYSCEDIGDEFSCDEWANHCDANPDDDDCSIPVVPLENK